MDRSRSSAKQRYEQRIRADRAQAESQNRDGIDEDEDEDDEDDEEAGKTLAKKKGDEKVENPEEAAKIKFKSCKLE